MSGLLADVAVVTYRSGQAAPEQLASLAARATENPRARWTFVDNSPTGEDAAFLRSRLGADAAVEGRTRIWEHRDNPGFAGACNEVLASSEAVWLVLVNPDVLLDSSTYDHLVHALDNLAADDVDAVAFSMQTGRLRHEGISVNPQGWFMDRPLGQDRSHRPGRGVSNRARLYRLIGGAGALLGPSGGAAAYRTQVLRRLGGLDAEMFGWGEDAELAMRLVRGGHRSVGLDLGLPHVGGHSVADRATRRRRAELLARNRIWVAARHYRTWRVAAFTAFLAASLVVKLPRMVLGGLLGAHLAGVAAGVRDFRAQRVRYAPGAGAAGPRW